jgi:hypothetical protein
MKRRNFIKSNTLAAMTITGSTFFPDFLNGNPRKNDKKSYAEYLRKSAVPKEELDIFLNENSWAQFDPEVGYILGNYMPHDGIDNSYTISTAQKDGRRTNQIYAGKTCRINTYGNSFTQCHQVSDAETWQEYLAGHLGEPVKNFGMGGFGVYQAYRRLVRQESTDNDSRYVILYMWGDDYVRSVFRCRYVTYYTTWNDYGGYMFHGNFWSNIEMDLDNGKLVEKENRLNKKEEVYKMTDPEFMYENLKDDLMIQLHLLSSNMVNTDVDMKGLNRLSEILKHPEVDFSDIEKMQRTANALKNKYSFEATKYILKKAKEFCLKNGKNLLLIHFDPYGVFRPMVRGEARYDQEVIDFIQENGFRFFDMNSVHAEDFKKFNLGLDDYMQRYFIGHYNPSGNHFFAYALKDILVDWMDPKPITYQQGEDKLIRFKGYLEE